MKLSHHYLGLAALCAAALSGTAAQAQQPPLPPQNAADGPQASDPQRWYVDDATRQEQLRTLRKEIGAARDEAQKQCRQLPASDRGACLKDADTTYQQDMARSEQLREQAHPPS